LKSTIYAANIYVNFRMKKRRGKIMCRGEEKSVETGKPHVFALPARCGDGVLMGRG
jgi:hypothetical protein